MKAELLFHERIDYDDGSIVEMKDLAGTVARSAHDSRTQILFVLWAAWCPGHRL
jgi:hypothetical protein